MTRVGCNRGSHSTARVQHPHPLLSRIKAGHGKANANLSLFQLPKATYLGLLCCLTSGVLASRVFGDAADMELGKTWIHFQATSKSYSLGQDPVSGIPRIGMHPVSKTPSTPHRQPKSTKSPYSVPKRVSHPQYC